MSITSLIQLREQLSEHFNQEELKDLCFELALDYEDLPASGKKYKVRELVQEMYRKGRLLDLIRALEQARPHLKWPRIDVFTVHADELPGFGTLLPYLVDRTVQEERLEDALKAYMHQPAQRPFVCLVHGDEQQCHDKYLERVLDFLSSKLETADGPEPIKEYPLLWPERLSSIQDLHTRLCKNFAHTILGYRHSSLDELNQRLALISTPVLVHTDIIATDWQRHGPDTINQYLDFWQRWPPIPMGQYLFVFLFIKYPVTQSGGFLNRIWSRRPLSQQIVEFLETLSVASFDQMHCTVLPRLNNISRREVYNWLKHQELKLFRRYHDLEADVRQIFERSETDTMPMETVARKLKDILERYTTG